MNVNEILNVFKTQLEVFQFITKFDNFSQKFLRPMSFLVERLLKNQSNKFDELLSDSSFQNFLRVDLYNSNKISFHIENTLSKKRYLVSQLWNFQSLIELTVFLQFTFVKFMRLSLHLQQKYTYNSIQVLKYQLRNDLKHILH